MREPANRIQILKTDDPISKYSFAYGVLELWYVKVDGSSSALGSASLLGHASHQPSYSLTFLSLKPVEIPNLGHTCYLTTLVQNIFWVLPLRKSFIEYEL